MTAAQALQQQLFDTARLQRLMREAGADLLLVSRRPNVAYLTGCFGILYWDYPEVAHCLQVEDDGCQEPLFYAGITSAANRPFVVAHRNRTYVFRQHSWIDEIYGCCELPGHKDAAECIAAAVEQRDLATGVIALEFDHLPHRVFEELRGLLPQASLIDAGPLIRRLRAVKTPVEQARQRQAYRIAESVYGEVISLLRNRPPDLTVQDVRAMQMAMATRAGCPPLHFGYVFPQDNAAKMAWDHANAPSFGFDDGDVVLLDLGLIWQGYTTDFGRNLVLGRATPPVREAYERLKQCRLELTALVSPGVRVNEFCAQANEIRQRLGLPEVEFLGHSMGIECVEYPQLIPSDDTIIEEGMTLVVELSASVEKVTFLLEDAGVVTSEGWRSQTEMTINLIEVV
jgi:Xaa-Pro dipeptidase